MANRPLRVGIVKWKQDDGIASAISDTLNELGCEVNESLYNAKLSKDLDIVFTHGPLGSLTPLINQIMVLPSGQRPVFILWMTEQLPNPALPEWMRYTFGKVRSQAERLAFFKNTQEIWELNPHFQWMTTKAHRFRYYGDLHWLRQKRYPFVLAVGSQWIANFMRVRGFDPIVAYIGFHPDWQKNLALERDIPVLWLGKTATYRRKHLLKYIRAGLNKQGIKILAIDGVENAFVFGEARTILLNRAKIVLNILRTPWDNNGLRYYLAASNRSLIVTEPTLDHTLLVSGVHLVETQIKKMADTICYYLTHEKERQRIVEQAYQLVTTELTMKKGVSQILEKAITVSNTITAPDKANKLDA